MSGKTLSSPAAALASVAALVAQPTTTENPASLAFNSGVSGALSAWQQIIASTAASLKHGQLSGSVSFIDTESGGTNGELLIEIGIGAGGAEVVISSTLWRVLVQTSAVNLLTIPWQCQISRALPAGTRIAIRARSNDPTAAEVTASAMLEET